MLLDIGLDFSSKRSSKLNDGDTPSEVLQRGSSEWGSTGILPKIRVLASKEASRALGGYSPNSMNNPSEDEQPGPPFVQKITSSLSGSLLLSKK